MLQLHLYFYLSIAVLTLLKLWINWEFPVLFLNWYWHCVIGKSVREQNLVDKYLQFSGTGSSVALTQRVYLILKTIYSGLDVTPYDPCSTIDCPVGKDLVVNFQAVMNINSTLVPVSLEATRTTKCVTCLVEEMWCSLSRFLRKISREIHIEQLDKRH